MKKELRVYRAQNEKEPFIDWLKALKDVVGRAHITNRLNRAVFGNYGDYKSVGDGVLELRIHYGLDIEFIFRSKSRQFCCY